MIFLYYKEEILQEIIDVIEQRNFKIRVKKIDMIAEQILKEHNIEKFPCLINWTSKQVYKQGEENILTFLKRKNVCI